MDVGARIIQLMAQIQQTHTGIGVQIDANKFVSGRASTNEEIAEGLLRDPASFTEIFAGYLEMYGDLREVEPLFQALKDEHPEVDLSGSIEDADILRDSAKDALMCFSRAYEKRIRKDVEDANQNS
ncbi:hypothetical protein ACFL1B_02655 [Nanoarchaeota archaeon]